MVLYLVCQHLVLKESLYCHARSILSLYPSFIIFFRRLFYLLLYIQMLLSLSLRYHAAPVCYHITILQQFSEKYLPSLVRVALIFCSLQIDCCLLGICSSQPSLDVIFIWYTPLLPLYSIFFML